MTGIVIPWDPVALQLGPLVLAWHGIFSSLGILLGIWFAAWLAPRARSSPEDMWRAACPVIIGGLIGARLLYVAEHVPAFIRAPWRIVLVNEGGISVFGAVLGGMAGAALWARRARVSPTRLLDVMAPAFLLGQAAGRLGDIVNGEHLGAHAPGLPWAVIYTHPNTLGEIGVPVHPAVAYELLWDLAAALLATWLLRNGLRPAGASLCLSLFLYGLGRLWVGYFRLDQPVLAGIGLAQLIGLLAMLFSVFGIWLTPRTRVARVPNPVTGRDGG